MSPNRRTLAVGPSGRILVMVPMGEGCWLWVPMGGGRWSWVPTGGGCWSWSQQEDIGRGPSGRWTLAVGPNGRRTLVMVAMGEGCWPWVPTGGYWSWSQWEDDADRAPNRSPELLPWDTHCHQRSHCRHDAVHFTAHTEHAQHVGFSKGLHHPLSIGAILSHETRRVFEHGSISPHVSAAQIGAQEMSRRSGRDLGPWKKGCGDLGSGLGHGVVGPWLDSPHARGGNVHCVTRVNGDTVPRVMEGGLGTLRPAGGDIGTVPLTAGTQWSRAVSPHPRRPLPKHEGCIGPMATACHRSTGTGTWGTELSIDHESHISAEL